MTIRNLPLITRAGIATLLLCCGTGAATAASSLVAVSSDTYDSGGSDTAYAVCTTADDDVIVAGKSGTDIAVIKYNKNLWPLRTAVFDSGHNDVARSVALGSADSIIVAGELNNGSDLDMLLLHYDENLQTVISSRTYDRGGGSFDAATAVAVDSAHNIIVAGYSNEDYYVMKYDQNLQPVVSPQAYDNTAVSMRDYATAVAVDAQDNIIVTGYSHNGVNYDFMTIKYSPDLAVLATARYDSGSSDQANGVAVTADGHVAVAGSSGGRFFTILYDEYLTVVSSAVYGAGPSDIFTSVTADGLGNIIVAGQEAASNYLAVKYDQYLNVVATAAYDSGGSEKVNGVACDTENNIIVTGQSADNYFTIKYSAPPQVAAVTPGYRGATTDVRITGRSFVAGAVPVFSDPDITVNSVAVSPYTQITANITVAATATLGLSTVTVVNPNGEASPAAYIFETALREVFDPASARTITAACPTHTVQLDVPAGAFAAVSTITVSVIVSSAQASGSVRPTRAGALVSVSPSGAALQSIGITITYDHAAIAGFDEQYFKIGYYDATTGWTALASTLDMGANRVTAQTADINRLFTVVEFGGQTVVSGDEPVSGNAAVYPNPYRPGSGGDFDDTSHGEGIVFANLSGSFTLKIASLAGDLVYSVDTTADSGGRYVWNTRTTGGEYAANGVYLYYITGGLSTKGKLAILR